MSTDDGLVERQAPSNDSQAWEDGNFSGLYTGSNSTFLSAHWNQNIRNRSEELVVLFQDENFANGLTQGRYTSNRTTSNPWVANNFGFSQPKGSAFAMSLVSYRSGKHLMLYTVSDGNKLRQHEYTISDTSLDSKTIVSLTSESGKSMAWPLSLNALTISSRYRPNHHTAITSRSRSSRQSASVCGQ